jgi:16S rRNA (adenine1518-N6/adenine1519-N6)-dimethyltransferase
LERSRKSTAPGEASLLVQTRRLLRRFGIRAKKGLAQHFLIDEAVLRHVVSAAELAPSETVIEVGPGLGVLTKGLAARAGRVIAVEVDAKLAAILTETVGLSPNVTIINADVLELTPSEILARGGAGPFVEGYKVVANLPYYITSPVLRHFLEASVKPQRMVVMVQKEVGRNIVAKPGHNSLLSISVQLYGKPVIVRYVPARSFYPSPKVDSAILRIDVYQQPVVEVADVGKFFEMVKAGFSAPRKQLRNALSQGLSIPPGSAMNLLEEAGISPQRRAQTLSLDEWAKLYEVFAECST